MREVKKFISIDNKEFDNENECVDYEQTIIDYIADKMLFKECSECQNYSLCHYLIEKNVCHHGNLCSFIMYSIIKEFNK